MSQQEFENAIVDSVHQQTGTDSWHNLSFGKQFLTDKPLHLFEAIGVSNRLHWRIIQEMRQSTGIAIVQAVIVSNVAFGIHNSVVERSNRAAIFGFANRHVLMQAENPGNFIFVESLLTKRSFKKSEKTWDDSPIVRFRNANRKADKQGRLVDKQDALAAFDGENVSVPISDG
jgi:hypothetical protein